MSFINFNSNGDFETKTTLATGEEGGDSSKINKERYTYHDGVKEDNIFEEDIENAKSDKLRLRPDWKLGHITTNAMGEEGGESSRITNSLSEMGIEVISKAQQEEGGDDFLVREGDPKDIGKKKPGLPPDCTKTSMRVGEEGGDGSRITNSFSEMGGELISKPKGEEGGTKTTLATGEEGGDGFPVLRGEPKDTIKEPELPDKDFRMTSMAVGEEGGDGFPVLRGEPKDTIKEPELPDKDFRMTSMAVGEEGGDGFPVLRGEPKYIGPSKTPSISEQIANLISDFIQNLSELMLKNLRR